MPTGNLPEKPKALWEKVYNESLAECEDDEECAAKRAWGAVRNAGWRKDSEGNWSKKSLPVEMSMVITKTSKSNGVYKWYAVASDTEDDFAQDNMTLELFGDFISRASKGEKVPEMFRTEYWDSGNPYVSLAHYDALSPDLILGTTEKLYVDGNRLKAVGTFNMDSKFGRAAYKSIVDDLASKESKASKLGRIRISIGFIDWEHIHKSDGYKFTRKEDELDDMCPYCLKELLTGNKSGKTFTKGHLIHFALTRVPMNERTLMEAKSMADQILTVEDDAKSIVGEELMSELGELVAPSKSAALVTKAKKEDEEDEVEDGDESEEEMEEEGTDGKKKGYKKEKSAYGVYEARIFESLLELKSKIEAVESTLAEIKKAELETPIENHPLDEAFAVLKSSFDEVVSGGTSFDEKLQLIQNPFQKFAESLKVAVSGNTVTTDEPLEDTIKRIVNAQNQPILEQLSLISAKLSNGVVPTASGEPQRRTLDPNVIRSLIQMGGDTPQPNAKKMSPSQVARRSVGLE